MDIILPPGELKLLLDHPLVRGLLEYGSDGAVVIDAETRRVLAINGRARELLGLVEDPTGCGCRATLDAPICHTACPLTRATQGETLPDVHSLSFRRHDDQRVGHAEARMLVIRNPEGRPVAAIELLKDEREIQALRRELRARRGVHGLVGRSTAMQGLYESLDQLAPCDLPVLIHGAAGTGKRRVAQALHGVSAWAHGPLHTVEVRTLPPALQGELLLGEDGARVHAEGGTLLLVGAEALTASVAEAVATLARTGQVRWNGALRTFPGRRLVLTATDPPGVHPALAQALGGTLLAVPELARRLEDLPLLVDDLLAARRAELQAGPEVLAALARRPWPGNLRQLERVLAAAVLRAGDRPRLQVADLDDDPALAPASPGHSLADVEAQLIAQALDRSGGRLGSAAQMLGIDRSTLWRKLKRLREEGQLPA